MPSGSSPINTITQNLVALLDISIFPLVPFSRLPFRTTEAISPCAPRTYPLWQAPRFLSQGLLFFACASSPRGLPFRVSPTVDLGIPVLSEICRRVRPSSRRASRKRIGNLVLGLPTFNLSWGNSLRLTILAFIPFSSSTSSLCPAKVTSANKKNKKYTFHSYSVWGFASQIGNSRHSPDEHWLQS